MCHKLNNAIHWVFNDKPPRADSGLPLTSKKMFVLSVECPNIKNSISGVKNIVTYFKRAGLNYKLKNTLKQENDTRWNSKLTMLESYIKSSSEAKKILVDKDQVDKLIGINDSAVVELISFLKPFKECTEAWSYDKAPTIQNVVLRVVKLREHIQELPSDSAEIRKLKAQAKLCLDEYLELDDIYYAACMLNPR